MSQDVFARQMRDYQAVFLPRMCHVQYQDLDCEIGARKSATEEF